jgi:hypothetical protein
MSENSASGFVASQQSGRSRHCMIGRMLVAYILAGGGKIIDEGIAPREGLVVDRKPVSPTNS